MIDTNNSARLHLHWSFKVIAIICGVVGIVSVYYAFRFFLGAYQYSEAAHLLPGFYFLLLTLLSLLIFIQSKTKVNVDNEGMTATCPPYGTYAMRWEEVNSFKKFKFSTVFYGDEKALKLSSLFAGKGRKEFKEYIAQQITYRQIEEYKPAGMTRLLEWKLINNSKVGKKITIEREFATDFKQAIIDERIDEVLSKFGYTLIEYGDHIYKREGSRLKNMIAFSPKSRGVEALIHTSEEENKYTLVNVTYTIDATGQLFLSNKEKEYWDYEINSLESLVSGEEVDSFDIDQEAQEVSRQNWITASILIGLPIFTLVFIGVLGKSSSNSSFSQFIYLILSTIISLIIAISIVKSRLSTRKDEISKSS